MSNYIIITDSACDLPSELLHQWGVPFVNMTFKFENEEQEYANENMPIQAFYDKMRNGSVAKTSAINSEAFRAAFEKQLQAGLDLLYLGFSSALSTTYNSARIAADALRAQYPERKILAVDSLGASAGQGLLLHLMLQKQKSGATIEETAAYAEDIKLRLCHWFTVDDLVYLKRGGRISPAAAFVGNVLGIKPVLHVDNEGHLINKMKVRGRKKAIATLVDKYSELAEDAANGIVYISQADCEEEAKELAELLRTKHNVTVDKITNIGPVIGAHSGPGTIALFFVGKER